MATQSQGLDLQLGVEIREALKSLKEFQSSAAKSLKGVEEQTKKTADAMGSAFSAFKGVAAAALAVFSAKQVADFFKAGIDGAIADEQALKRLQTAMELTGDYSDDALQSLSAFADGLEKSTKFSGDLVTNQLALAKSFGVSNEEAQKLVTAAADLASATGKDLETTVRELGKTLGGTTGKLKDQIPVLSDLTKEQLAAGKAIDIVLERFGGSAAKEIDTFGGAVQQLENAFQDLQKVFGRAIIENPAVVAAIQTVKDVLNLLTSTAEDSKDGLTTFVTFVAQGFVTGLQVGIDGVGFFVRAVQGIVVTANLAFDGLVTVVAGGTKKVAELAGEAADSILGMVEDLAKAAEETPGLDKVLGLAGFDVGEISGSIGGLRETIKAGVKDVTDTADAAMEASFESTAGVVETFESFNRGFEDFQVKVATSAQKVYDADTKIADSAKKAAEGRKALSRETEENAKAVAKLAEEAKKFAEKVTEANLSEAGKLAAERDKQLKEIETFEKKKVIAAKEAADLRVEVENTYIAKLTELEDKQLKAIADNAKKAGEIRKKAADEARNAIEQAAASPISVLVKAIFSDEEVSFGEGLAASLSGLSAYILNGARGATQLLADGFSVAADAFLPGLGGVVGPLVQQLAKGPEENAKMVKEFVSSFPTLITNIAESMPAIVEALVDSLINEGGIIKIAVALARALAGEAIFKAIGEQLGIDLASSFNASNIAQTLGNGLREGARAVGAAIAGGIPRLIQAFGDGLQRFGVAVHRFFSDMPAAFVKGGVEIQKSIQEGATAFLQGIRDVFGRIIGEQFTFLTSIRDAFSTFFSGIANAFPTPPWVEDIKKFFEGLEFDSPLNQSSSKSPADYVPFKRKPTRENPLGFANGADFIVPPGFPNDSFGPMYAQTGERVKVTKASDVAGGGGDQALLSAMLRVAQLLEGRQVVDATITIDGKAIQRQMLELDRRHARVSA